MAAQGEGASADDTWTCPRCTLTNEDDDMICSVCGSTRPSNTTTGTTSRGKGRVLRPRAPPAMISKPVDSPQPDEDDQDDADEVDEPVPTKRATRSKRAPRGRGAKGKGARDGRNGSSGSGNDSSGSGVDREDFVSAAVTATSLVTLVSDTAEPATEAISGALQQPVELDDDSDQQSDNNHDGSTHSVNDVDDISGENPPLFGRGWGASATYINNSGGHNWSAPVLASAAGGGSSGARSARRGKKRHRALPPSCSGDDIFRSRKYAETEASESDGGGEPLTSRRRVAFVKDTRRPFWRWPPAPAVVHSGYAAVCGEAGKEGMARNNSGGCSSGVAEDGLGASGAAGGGGGEGGQQARGDEHVGVGAGGDGFASRGSSAVAGDAVEQLTQQELSVSQSQQQGRRSQRKRSRLSLPRKHADDECKDDKSDTGGDAIHLLPTPPTSQPEDTDHPTGVHGGGLSERDTRGAAGDGSAEKMHVDSPRGGTVDVRGGAADDGGDVGREGGGAEGGVSEEQGAGGQVDGPSTAAAEGGSKHGAQQSAQGCAHTGGGGAVGEARGDAASTAGDTGGAGAVASSAWVRPRRGIPMDFGNDSDSDSSDGSETQSDANRDGGVAHLGLAMDGALDRPSEESAFAPSASSSSAVPSPASAPPMPTASTGADLDGATPALSPVESTPPRRKPGGKGGKAKAREDDSPDSSSMGLVDTPPSGADKVASVSSAVDASSTQRSSRVTRAGARLASSPGFASASSSQSPPGLDLPPASTAGSVIGSRGEWTCGACTLVNRARCKKCSMCGIGEPTSSNSVKGLGLGGGGGGASDPVDGGGRLGNAEADPGPDGGDGEDGITADDPAAAGGGDSEEPSYEASGDAQTTGDVSKGSGAACVGDEDVEAAGVSASRPSVSSSRKPGGESDGKADGDKNASAAGLAKGGEGWLEEGGFDSIVEAILSETEEAYYDEEDGDEEEDYDEDRGSDEDWNESEMIASQIEDKFRKSQDGPSHRPRQSSTASPRKTRRLSRAADDVLDLTDAVEEHEDTGGVDADHGEGKRAAKSDAEYSIEDISDDDEFETGRPSRPGARGNGNADGVEEHHWDAGEDGQYPPSPPKRFRFFSSVAEHLNQDSSCVDFSSMAEAPAGGASGSKSYDARKRARDSKATRKGKRGKKARKPRATPSARGRGSAVGGRAAGGRGASGRGGRRGGAASRSSVRPFGRGAGLPSSIWMPQGIATSAVAATSSAAGGRRGGSSAGGRGAAGQRQPFNHYRGNDDMVDDSNGGGGSHWEHVGTSSFGD